MIKAGEISEIIRRQIQEFEGETDLTEIGRVIEVGDGIARVYGLERAMAGELLTFPQDVVGHGPEPRGGQRRGGAARR